MRIKLTKNKTLGIFAICVLLLFLLDCLLITGMMKDAYIGCIYGKWDMLDAFVKHVVYHLEKSNLNFQTGTVIITIVLSLMPIIMNVKDETMYGLKVGIIMGNDYKRYIVCIVGIIFLFISSTIGLSISFLGVSIYICINSMYYITQPILLSFHTDISISVLQRIIKKFLKSELDKVNKSIEQSFVIVQTLYANCKADELDEIQKVLMTSFKELQSILDDEKILMFFVQSAKGVHQNKDLNKNENDIFLEMISLYHPDHPNSFQESILYSMILYLIFDVLDSDQIVAFVDEMQIIDKNVVISLSILYFKFLLNHGGAITLFSKYLESISMIVKGFSYIKLDVEAYHGLERMAKLDGLTYNLTIAEAQLYLNEVFVKSEKQDLMCIFREEEAK